MELIHILPARTCALALLLAALAGATHARPADAPPDSRDAAGDTTTAQPKSRQQDVSPAHIEQARRICRSAKSRAGHPTARPRGSLRKACKVLEHAPVAEADARLVSAKLMIESGAYEQR